MTGQRKRSQQRLERDSEVGSLPSQMAARFPSPSVVQFALRTSGRLQRGNYQEFHLQGLGTDDRVRGHSGFCEIPGICEYGRNGNYKDWRVCLVVAKGY